MVWNDQHVLKHKNLWLPFVPSPVGLNQKLPEISNSGYVLTILEATYQNFLYYFFCVLRHLGNFKSPLTSAKRPSLIFFKASQRRGAIVLLATSKIERWRKTQPYNGKMKWWEIISSMFGEHASHGLLFLIILHAPEFWVGTRNQRQCECVNLLFSF